MTMKNVAFIVMLAACGGKPPPLTNGSGSAEPIGPVEDSRSAIEKRRDIACEALAPSLVGCAVDDARADLASGKTTQKQFDADTAPGVLKVLGEKWLEKCEVDLSSRQGRR